MMDNYESSIHRIMQERDEALESLIELKKSLSTNSTENNYHLQQEIALLKDKLNTSQSLTKEQASQIEALKSKDEIHNSQLEELKNKHSIIIDKYTQQMQINKNNEDLLTKLNEKAAALESEIQAKNNKIEELQKELLSVNLQYQSLIKETLDKQEENPPKQTEDQSNQYESKQEPNHNNQRSFIYKPSQWSGTHKRYSPSPYLSNLITKRSRTPSVSRVNCISCNSPCLFNTYTQNYVCDACMKK